MARQTSVWTQQFEGAGIQYLPIQDYVHDETTTGGFQAGLYTGGGLVDIREVEAEARASGDTILLGQAEVIEGLMIGTGADLFGDLTYSQALTNTPNPPLDNQLDVYDAVQAVLSDAVSNLTTASLGGTNFGAGNSDLVYAGSPAKWAALAHTAKARFFLHTAEVRPAAYASALTEAQLGITDPANDYKAVYSGDLNEQNYWYQFDVVQRAGYITPNTYLINKLDSLSDPRLLEYFRPDTTFNSTTHAITSITCCSDLSNTRIAADFSQPLVTAQENLLIWSESAFRTSSPGVALTELNAARAAAATVCSDETGGTCVIPPKASAGAALLRDILTEKYIADFQNIEAWNDYKRTCFPNFTPTVTGLIIPARMFYDLSERQTNTSIPAPGAQPSRNANDPANAFDDFGVACKGQTP